MTLLALAGLREAAAAALAPASADDPPVFADPVDSLTPPALLLDWADPWLDAVPGVIGSCQWTARLQVICIAGRYEPGPGIGVLEQLVTHVVHRLDADTYTWPLDTATAPMQRDLAGVAYLAANVVYAVPIEI